MPKSISLLNAGYSASEYTPLLYVHDYTKINVQCQMSYFVLMNIDDAELNDLDKLSGWWSVSSFVDILKFH